VIANARTITRQAADIVFCYCILFEKPVKGKWTGPTCRGFRNMAGRAGHLAAGKAVWIKYLRGGANSLKKNHGHVLGYALPEQGRLFVAKIDGKEGANRFFSRLLWDYARPDSRPEP
jgi:hypothetical protein